LAGYDRDEVLARTDLAQLATDICGPPAGRGRSARWHCPNPDHPDTHPSMTVFSGLRTERWKCHACGEGGTAIDLWMISQHAGVGGAITALGDRCGADTPAPAAAPPRLMYLQAKPIPIPLPAPQVDRGFDVRVESYVASAAELLWSPPGEGARHWLRSRGLSDAVLRANRVGYDPGPRGLRRPKGLPWRGSGIVLPILGPGEHAIWVQTRYLDPHGTGRKYDSVASDIAANPRVATIRAPKPPRPGVVILTEGIPDGLTVAHTCAQPVAVVGTGNTGPDVAQRLHAAFPQADFVVAFDNDIAGRTTGPKLGAHLAELGHLVIATTAPSPHNDLNDWWRADPDGLTEKIENTLQSPLHRAAGIYVPTPAL
jgi:hypothetical protein